MTIYQTLPRLFGNYNTNLIKNGTIEQNGCGKFASYTDKALQQIRELGITHIWYTGIIAHATQTDYSTFGIPHVHRDIVKGKAGSPYAVTDYYDVDPDLANDVGKRMNEFEALVERTHNAGMKVIIDFVPNHVARTYRSTQKPIYVDDLGQHDRTDCAFLPTNNFYYLPNQRLELHFDTREEDFEYSEFPAKATGNNCFNATPSRNDWYETVKLNYGIDYQNGTTHFSPVPDTWKKMLDILIFWADKEIDGFRCDMAEMVPVEFWEWAIPRVKSRKNVIFIAEVYNPNLYRDYIHRGHFDYLYDKVGFYDTMRRIIRHESPAKDILNPWQENEDIRNNMLFFLENHDEQRIASDFFAGNAQAAIPAMIVAATVYTNPVMIYNGQELGERGMDEEGFSGRDGRTTIFDYWSMPCFRNRTNNGLLDDDKLSDEQKQLRQTYKRILNLAANEKAFTKGQFYGLIYCNIENPQFNSEEVLAFLRKYENETIIVAANFSNTEQTVRINIPQNAFDVLGLEDNKAAATLDLLTGEKNISTLTTKCPYQLTIPAHNGRMVKWIFR